MGALMCLPRMPPDYMQHLFNETPFSAGGRWLMVHVADEHVLEDVKKLVQVRRKIPR